MNIFYKLALVASLFLLNSCGAYFNQPMLQKKSRTGEFSSSTQNLLDLPEAANPVEVAVYNFSDQTGQYKPVENGSTFSTAITQGGTTILIKALEDSGWFIPIERENLTNLTTERNIIRNTKKEYIKNLNPNEPPLPPLLYAGLLLEGGVVSYDTNIVTGGLGARYFGLGGSAQYRQDRITVYLRAVSTNNGEILKTIYVSKTILSQALDASFFRFVKFQRLFEAETGITQNEPVQLAVKDAIEKAVHDLIVEGVKDQFWGAQGGKAVNDKLVATYEEEKQIEESTRLYDRLFVEREYSDNLSFTGGLGILDGDYNTNEFEVFAGLGYQKRLSPYFRAGVSANVFQLDYGAITKTSDTYGSIEFNLQLDILPNDDISPYLYAGGGLIQGISNKNTNATFFKAQYGGGVEYFLSPRIGLKIFAEHNIDFNDELDRLVAGRRDDFYFNFGAGFNYYFNLSKKSVTKKLN
ncbi:CsgG/HfaB family protein [Cochleicola gelatinilyticus]|uniref:Uncharacterized protein n=1 Tax=Cochleicola gelatinilyticus TaxID=1763537 RepID=A0A167ERS6_9FLAO|nr:CsgG/HfaB family protein [Cochleicola gelatinilyticus]OAB75819.1 hypothetical protein ULVI_15195 [Cochleicola gelatinilyticus]